MKRFLLIDDDGIFNFIHTEVIKNVDPGAEITSFSSSLDGLNYITSKLEKNEDLPDYLFLDIRMPEMDGFELLQQLEKYPHEKLQSMKIYMLTSSLDDRDRMKAFKSPLVKGFKSKTLTITLLTEILEGTDENHNE